MYDTKVNLATILGIIVFLAVMAFLFYPVRSGPHRAIATTCLSNIKNQSFALTMYAADYDDILPKCEAWKDQADPYFNYPETMHCPAIYKAIKDAYGYAMNYSLSKANIAKLANPDRQVMILESIILDRNACSNLVGFPNPSRHKRNSIAFADGHAKTDTSLAKYR